MRQPTVGFFVGNRECNKMFYLAGPIRKIPKFNFHQLPQANTHHRKVAHKRIHYTRSQNHLCVGMI